jgi:hypothetical protein
MVKSVQIGKDVCKCSEDRSRGLLSDEYSNFEIASVFWKMGGRWTGRKLEESEEGQAGY